MRLYLDAAATTPLLPEAAEAMRPWLEQEHGNPSSLHAEGRRAKLALDEARETVSNALGCMFGELHFTSSGTEAANLAIIGLALHNTDFARNRVILGAAEHHCVLHTRETLERLGYRVDLCAVNREGGVNPAALENLMAADVLLVSMMHANNELGTINPVALLADLAHSQGAIFHTDAVQTFPFDGGNMPETGADLLSVSAHKLYGPKGVGALAVKAGVKLKPVMVGGGQERELRAGTENVAGAVGFAEAVKWCQANPIAKATREAARDAFRRRLEQASPIVPQWTVMDSPMLGGHAHLRLPGISAETMLIRLDRMGVSASSGAACSSGSLEPSHVLLACGYSMEEAKEGLRFSFGKGISTSEAEKAAELVAEAAEEILKTRT